MGIWGLWSGGEPNPLMTLGKLNVEKSNKRLGLYKVKFNIPLNKISFT